MNPRKIRAEDWARERLPGGRPSKLAPFREDLLKLDAMGYTQKDQRDFLAANGVTVTQQSLSDWWKRERARGSEAPQLASKSVTVALQSAAVNASPAPATQSPATPAATSLQDDPPAPVEAIAAQPSQDRRDPFELLNRAVATASARQSMGIPRNPKSQKGNV